MANQNRWGGTDINVTSSTQAVIVSLYRAILGLKRSIRDP